MKAIILTCLIPLAACAAPDPAYQQALANVPPAARTYCDMQAQMAGAASYSSRSLRNLESGMYAVKMHNTCMQMMVQQYGTYQPQPQFNEEQLKTMVRGQIAKYGMEPVKACYVAARDVSGDDMVKLRHATDCVGRLRPV